MMQKIFSKVFGMVYRAVIRMIDDTGDVQKAQISGLTEETLDETGVYGQYGIAARPPAGIDAIAVNVGASREHGVIIATSDSARPKNLNEGDVYLYDLHGNQVQLVDGKVTIVSDEILLGSGSNKAVMHEDIILAIQSMLGSTTASTPEGGGAVTFVWGYTANPTWANSAKSTVAKTK